VTEGTPLITYGDDGAAFSRACPSCGRFVKPDGEIRFNEETGPKQERNATCSRCGRVEMDFVGYVEVGP
jgi:ribosomal protein S27AE